MTDEKQWTLPDFLCSRFLCSFFHLFLGWWISWSDTTDWKLPWQRRCGHRHALYYFPVPKVYPKEGFRWVILKYSQGSQANGFALQVRKTNQLGRLMISQRTFQPGKRYGFFCCGFRLFFVKEEIRQLPRGRIPYYMNHKGKTHPKKHQLRSVSVSVFKSVIISPRVRLNGALILFCKCSYLSLSIASR